MSPRQEAPDSLPGNVWLVGQENSLRQRRGRYTPGSMRHPGKMLPALARRIIREYTRPGDWILDPLSGIGTTGVEAMHLGRRYVGIELHRRYAAWQRANLDLARTQGASGEGYVIQGDARLLARPDPVELLPAAPRIDAVITSPPYGPRLSRAPARAPRLPRRTALSDSPVPDSAPAGDLGSLSDADYRHALLTVYRGCYRVLRPGGLLIVVVRAGRDGWRLRPLHHEAVSSVQAAGFELLDEIIALTGRVDLAPEEPVVHARSLYFKRQAILALRQAGHPVALDQTEYVLVFRKTAAPVLQLQLPRRKSDLAVALADPLPPSEIEDRRDLVRRRDLRPL